MQAQVDDELEEFKLDSHEVYVNSRTSKISNVSNSLTKIHKMYENLNQIVHEQGETLNRLEDNVGGTKTNTKKTVE